MQLWELLGLARAGGRYAVLGLTVEAVQVALNRAQQFWCKAVELQQVIDESLKNFKAFFRWVYVEILRLSDETVTAELSRVSQQDITFIAEFLRRLEPGAGTEAAAGSRNLERVGQYLGEEDLLQPPDTNNKQVLEFQSIFNRCNEYFRSFWHQLLMDCPELATEPGIIPAGDTTSLTTAHANLVRDVQAVFSGLAREVTDQSQASFFVECVDT